MSKKKKSGDKDNATLKAIVFATAILNLINALRTFIEWLLDSS